MDKIQSKIQWIIGLCGITDNTPTEEALEAVYKRVSDMKECVRLILDDVGLGDGENGGFIDCEIHAFKIRELERSLRAMNGPVVK